MLKRMTAVLALAILTLPLAFGQTPPLPPPREAAPLETISVTGTGRVQLAPDRVSFSVGVETTATTVADAVDENSRKVARIIAALKKEGVQDKEIRTSNFSVSPQYDYQSGGNRPRLIGFQVTNMVTVTRDKTANVSKLLQAVIDAGANQIHGISFVVADVTRSRDEGLRLAFQDARAKADVLARAAGRTLGRAMAITEGGATMPPPMPMRGMVANAEMMAKAPDVPIEQGTEELTHTVSVVFELR